MGEVIRIESTQEEEQNRYGNVFREITQNSHSAEFNTSIRKILEGRGTTRVSRLSGLLVVVRDRTNELSTTLLGPDVSAVAEFALRNALSDNDLMRSVPITITNVNLSNRADKDSYNYLVEDTQEYSETPVFAVLAAAKTVAFFTPEMTMADYYMRRKILDAIENN